VKLSLLDIANAVKRHKPTSIKDTGLVKPLMATATAVSIFQHRIKRATSLKAARYFLLALTAPPLMMKKPKNL
jgi:hypothetical protein